MDAPLSENPYEPPKASDPQVADGRFWRVEGDSLWIRDGAAIHGVDLVTGEIGPADPVPRKVHISRMTFSSWFGLLVIVAVLLWDNLGSSYTGHKPQFRLFWIALLLIALVKPFSRMMPQTAGLLYDEPGARAKKRKRLNRVAVAIALLGPAAYLLLLFGFRNPSARYFPVQQTLTILGVWVVCLITIAIIRRPLDRAPGCPTSANGWFQLSRIPLPVIAHLRNQQFAQGDATGTGDWIYSIDFAKFTWRQWGRALRWKPWPLFKITLKKLLHSPWVVDGFKMRRSLEPAREDELTPSFLEWVQGRQPTLEADGWRPLLRTRLESVPQLAHVSQSAIFLHTNRRDCLTLSDSSVRSGTATRQGELHTWLENGTVLRTIDQAALPLTFPGVLQEEIPGVDLPELIRRHRERADAAECLHLTGPDEVPARMFALAQRNHEWFVERGIFGPLRDEFGGNS